MKTKARGSLPAAYLLHPFGEAAREISQRVKSRRKLEGARNAQQQHAGRQARPARWRVLCPAPLAGDDKTADVVAAGSHDAPLRCSTFHALTMGAQEQGAPELLETLDHGRDKRSGTADRRG